MNDFNDDSDSINSRLQELEDRSEALFKESKLRTALRTTNESLRLAQNSGNVVKYMYALFNQMRFGEGLLDPQLTREAAVKLIVLLQDEEQARRIEPALDEGIYSWVCSWMSTCAYDNLAESTGLMSGYNSTGMHECINEGIQVCRQTGKLECIKCFRIYASDVYLASDDMPMVRYQCQTLLEGRERESQDRRWKAYERLAWVNALEGRLLNAESDLEKGLEVSTAENVYLKQRAKLIMTLAMNEVRLLLGKGESTPELDPSEFPEEGEWPRFELIRAKFAALKHAVNGDFQEAINILTQWDQTLSQAGCLDDWFEVRLRLIAAYLLSDKRSRAETLAKGIEAKAAEAQDHLTQRRLKVLMDPETRVCAVPLVANADCGVFGPAVSDESTDSEKVGLQDAALDLDDEIGDADADDVVETVTPLSGILAEYMQEILASAEDEVARQVILEKILSHQAGDIEEAGDAAYLVHLARYVTQGTEEALRVWEWALQMKTQFPDDAVMLSVVASLGHFFLSADEESFEKLIKVSELEVWFRLSMSINPNHPRNFARAGTFFLEEGMTGDAEQAFARAFRLDRKDGAVAHQLADIYRETDRPRDALAVLDLSLRKGTTDAHVAWEAAMTALQLMQYDMLLTYLDRYRSLSDQEQSWFHYYRGLAYFRLGRFEESLVELDEELNFDPPGQMHLHVIRMCALDQMGLHADAKAELEEFLNLSFVDVDYLSLHGLVRLSEAMCDTIREWPEDDPLRKRAALRLLRAGLLSDEYLEAYREQNEEVDDVKFYRVQLRQPLEANWRHSEGCLVGQEDWTEYLIDWGVLAQNEDDAINDILEFQNVCEKQPAVVIHVDEGEDAYRERPGVVWQGYRRSENGAGKLISGGEA
ncbi:tetratricopeptide repeat protein [Planctomicrobium sp. SH668]|uniref:tetratricopeptide repeat protein n=1 Tax=Planctomicrobium sp. SH668 TaxID=3448126 RepID=UPI003F5B63FF